MHVRTIDDIDRETFDRDVRHGGVPVILKGLGKTWPIVQAARQSVQALGDYLRRHDAGRMVEVAICPRDQNGRFFYNDDVTGLNYRNLHQTLTYVAGWCLANGGAETTEAVYIQAQTIDRLAPGMAAELPMPLLEGTVRPRLWVGNTLRTQTHFDYDANIAVHVAGRKTFTLFAPDQTGNLYPGPLDHTPAGVPISMASLEEPDFVRYPRLVEALKTAQTVDLEPGDGLFIPPLWWHHVQTTGPLNALVNYWWNPARDDLIDPMKALKIAAMTWKAMPSYQRDAWRELLDYYVFEGKGDPVAHLPRQAQDVYGRDPSAELVRTNRQALKL